MIIECEGCHSKFRLDEKRLKKTGSKVRCSKCNHAFIVFPPEIELQLEETSLKEEEATVVSPKDVEIAAPKETEDVLPEEAPEKEDQTSTFDKTLSLEFEEVVEPISIDDLPDFEEDLLDENGERQAEIQGAMDRAKRIEEEVIDREQPKKAREAEVVEAPAKRRPVAKKRRTSGLLITILVIILLFVGAVAAVQFFAPNFFPGSFPFFKKSPPEEQALDLGNKRLSFNDLEGAFVNSKRVGKLFVVKGVVTNMYPDKRNFVRIRSNILDSKRMVVSSKIVFAGNPLSDQELQALSLVEIDNRLRDKFGKNRMNLDILPNASIPFMIVFSNLPKDMSEFTVEAISSSPEGK